MSTFDPARAVEAVAEPPSPLIEDTMARLKTAFATRDHRPSGDHWNALRDVVSTMADMASGAAANKVFLSPIDPGVGKTSAVVEFASSLMSSRAHRRAGMLICVGRIEEARSLGAKLTMDNPHASVAVVTSDLRVNSISTVERPTDAQVIITTQQRLEIATERAVDKRFEARKEFYYQGSVRPVRVWDEAFLPGEPVTVTEFEVLRVLLTIQGRSAACAEAVREFALRFRANNSGDVLEVPDFQSEHDVSFYDMASTAVGDESKTLRHLAVLDVCTVTGRLDRRC